MAFVIFVYIAFRSKDQFAEWCTYTAIPGQAWTGPGRSRRLNTIDT